MKTWTLLAWAMMMAGFAFGQKPSCKSRLDSLQALEIALKNGAWPMAEGSLPTRVSFDSLNCEWTVVASRQSHTRKGKCKFTNGCTLVSSLTLVLDAKTKRLKSKKKSRKLYPNYE
jgi:hypothetical protein